MATDRSDRTRRWKTRRRLLCLALWALFTLWFAHFAYVRWTTPPAMYANADALPSGAPVSDAGDVAGASLLAAIRALPPIPATASSPAFGWGSGAGAAWAQSAVRGTWNPAANAEQMAVVNYLTAPGVAKALDRVSAACEDRRRALPGEFSKPTDAPPGAPPAMIMDEYTSVVSALTVRARRRTAEAQDSAGALRDLRAVLYLMELELRLPVPYYYYSIGGVLPQFELGCLAREVDLPAEQARQMIAFLRDELSLSPFEVVSDVLALDGQVERTLDRYYTDDGRGNGWLVLSAATDQLFTFGPSRSAPANRAWNVFSPLFNDRSTMRSRLTGLTEDLRKLDAVSYRTALSVVVPGRHSGRRTSVLDGPLMNVVRGLDEYRFQALLPKL